LEIDEDEDQFYKDAKIDHKISKTVFTEEEIESLLISNVTLFFFAGFDNTAMGMSLAMYFLAKYPDAQARLYEEVSEAVEKAGKQHLDYETVQNMPFLEQVNI